MRVAIIGGYGKMGRWLARALRAEGLQVTIAGRDETKLLEAAQQLGVKAASASEAVKSSEVVILSVPIDSFEAACKELAPAVKPGQYIFDVTSIKARPVDIMHKHFGGCRVLGTHPIFGPGAASVSGQRFVLTPTNTEERTLAGIIRRYLEERGAKVAIMSPAEHDELMAIVLGLSHFIALVSADTLLELGKLKEAEAAGGTSYRLLLTLAEAVCSEDPDFYSSLQMNLPGIAEIEDVFLAKARQWAGLVKSTDTQSFAKRMNDLKLKFAQEDQAFGDAYNNAYRVLGESNPL
ncbi:MAG: prephenate dehydrogenase [Chloroflexi bacterium]|nr:prephenate dehydrogenase [Chloroflexota bacterium]